MTSEIARPGLAPELLAPAGNWDCATAAIENGADAIYFGLEVGFNARARAANFSLEELPQLMSKLHRQGVKGYVTLNTLVFTDELPRLEESVRALARAGVDAVLVQDLGVARLIREICPELEMHASTQMTLTCADAIKMAEQLGIARVVLARELSIKEIRHITQRTSMPIEVFVHGALCVAYSGQCLTSESFGGRSANRGQCAQACRLPYDMICDGQEKDLGPMRYLLSPQDLAAYELIPQLIDAGVCSLKIEGRLKTPEYVANITQHYRAAIDQAMQGRTPKFSSDSKREMELSFSRGFTPGWLEGCNHKRLVPGLSSAKKGVLVGHIVSKRGSRLVVQLDSPLGKGDGIVLEGDRIAGTEVGGRIFEIFSQGRSMEEKTSGRVEIALARGTVENAEVFLGQAIWQTDDPQLERKLRTTYTSADPLRRVPIDLTVSIEPEKKISLEARCHDGPTIRWESEYVAVVAQKHKIDQATLFKQFSRLGGSVYDLKNLEAHINGQPMVPLSVLGQLRHQMIEELDRKRTTPPERKLGEQGLAEKRISLVQQQAAEFSQQREPQLHVLCRSLQQLDYVLQSGIKSVIADFHDLRQYRVAVAKAKEASAKILVATLRIHKPGEDGLFLAIQKAAADGWLVRSLAALEHAQRMQVPFVCDFSLNVTNPLTAQQLLHWGAERLTASYDLNRDQLLELVACMPAHWLEVVIHQHMPMFHMEHCVFCTVLSPGTNKTNCGRPCDHHDVRLRDRVQVEHVLHADIGCRNTLYNGTPQSGAEAVAHLLKQGVRDFRIELLRDAPLDEVRTLVELYQQLLAGKLDGASVWKQLKASNRVGVTRGTLEQPRNPLAIL